MKDFLDKHPKLKNPMFYIGLIAIIFASAGIDATTLTSWNLLLTALVGIWNDNGTK